MADTSKKGITGSTLKLIALITMLIDHTALVVFERILNVHLFDNNSEYFLNMTNVYVCLRLIGRLAFPIYVFFLVEGFLHTRSFLKYSIRLFFFAIISEIPFDISVVLTSQDIRNGVFLEFKEQNVFFTLWLGLLAIGVLDFLRKCIIDITLRCIGFLITGLIFGGVAQLIRCDYYALGIAAIIITYAVRCCYLINADEEEEADKFPATRTTSMILCALVLSLFNLYEVTSFVDVLFIRKYNGKRGLKIKYLFYAFYPLHLAILGIVAYFIGV